MNLDDLIADLRKLGPDDLADVVDLVARLQARQAGDEREAAAMLDAMAADPDQRAEFAASLERARMQRERGEGRTIDDVLADFRNRARKRQAGG